MTSTAISISAAFAAHAQEVSYNLGVDGYVGTTLLPSGMSSSAQLGISGFGSGGVVVSNSGLNLVLSPEYEAEAATDFLLNPEQADIYGTIEVENGRSVEVSGVLSGVGTVAGTGTTTTTFDAQMIAGAGNSNVGVFSNGEVDSEDFEYEASLSLDMTGLARLAGESTSTAGFSMVGQTAGFLGELGTTVGGNFTAMAGFETDTDLYSDLFDGPELVDFEIELEAETDDDFNGINILAETAPISLAVASLGGGTMLLSGANNDVFEGGTLLTNEAAFEFEALFD